MPTPVHLLTRAWGVRTPPPPPPLIHHCSGIHGSALRILRKYPVVPTLDLTKIFQFSFYDLNVIVLIKRTFFDKFQKACIIFSFCKKKVVG